MAVDVAITLNAPDSVLDIFSATDGELRNHLYRGGGSPIFQKIKPIKSTEELGSHVMDIHQPIGTEEARAAVEVVKGLICEELVKFEFLPIEDNRVLLSFVAQTFPSVKTHMALVRAFTETLTFDCQARQEGLDFGADSTVDGEVDPDRKAIGEGKKALPSGDETLSNDAAVD